jgi:hypothetical protein
VILKKAYVSVRNGGGGCEVVVVVYRMTVRGEGEDEGNEETRDKKILSYPPTVLLKRNYVILERSVTTWLLRSVINRVSEWDCSWQGMTGSACVFGTEVAG